MKFNYKKFIKELLFENHCLKAYQSLYYRVMYN